MLFEIGLSIRRSGFQTAADRAQESPPLVRQIGLRRARLLVRGIGLRGALLLLLVSKTGASLKAKRNHSVMVIWHYTAGPGMTVVVAGLWP